ncbi:hypothetical protein D3C77_612720 [compost metagenome]
MQHKGFAAARREVGEHLLQLFEALLVLGMMQRVAAGVGRCLFIGLGAFFEHGVAHLLPTPMIAQQIARHLEQKRPWLLHPGAIPIPQPLGEDVLGHVGGIAGIVCALAQEMQDVGIEPTTGVMGYGVGFAALHASFPGGTGVESREWYRE